MEKEIEARAFPRAAIIGNPSDGYGGKTMAFVFDNFQATVNLRENDRLEIINETGDSDIYESYAALESEVKESGYFGKNVLLKALLVRFFSHYQKSSKLNNTRFGYFKMSYKSNIPFKVGLAGSSAILSAGLRVLLKRYKFKLEPSEFAKFVLTIETEQLDISAGLQDRVAQAYEQPIYMNFSTQLIDQPISERYKTLSKKSLPNFFIAYRTISAEGSEVVHNDLRQRFNSGEIQVRQAMMKFGTLTDQVFDLIQKNKSIEQADGEAFNTLRNLMNENFNLRSSICTISKHNEEMVEIARSQGAGAKFTGSGGAIIGVYLNEAMYAQLQQKFHSEKIMIIKPNIVG